MLRVLGITYDHTTNYGSCFQAYALQKAIETQTIKGESVDYQLIPIKTFRDYPRNHMRYLLLAPFMRLHRSQFRGFERKYIHFCSASVLSDLPRLNNQADAFVCGSDVIWSPDFNSGLGAYYLDFADKYKFSYAASFGKANINDSVCSAISSKLSALNAISVREKNGLEIVRRCTKHPAQVVSDPVLLLDQSHWSRIAVPSKQKEPYIFVYRTHLTPVIQSFLELLKRQTGLKTILSTTGPKQAFHQGILQVQTPEEWLGLLRDAEYIVTNSFHATALSVLFHKKFFTVVQGEKNEGINVRMNDFLNMIGLEDRIFSTVPQTIDLKQIDYTDAEKKIDALREQSLAFLRENLEAAYREKQQAESKGA